MMNYIPIVLFLTMMRITLGNAGTKCYQTGCHALTYNGCPNGMTTQNWDSCNWIFGKYENCCGTYTCPSSGAVVGVYIGYQEYSPSPPLANIPLVIKRLYAAFSRDAACTYNSCPAGAGSGNFIAQWDTNTYSPSAILTDKNANQRLWFASLFGDKPNWIDPPDQSTWINNAVTSLQNMIQQYYLDGLDIDLENGLTSTWVTCMSTVLQQLKQNNPSLLITLAPFSATWSYYVSLYNANPSLYDGINYQVYAEGITDVNGVVQKYQTLASTSNIPLSKFYFMIDTNLVSPRGIQPPNALQAYQQLRQQNPPIKGVTVWSADDDWHNPGNYNTEIQYAQSTQFTQCYDTGCHASTYNGCPNGMTSSIIPCNPGFQYEHCCFTYNC